MSNNDIPPGDPNLSGPQPYGPEQGPGHGPDGPAPGPGHGPYVPGPDPRGPHRTGPVPNSSDRFFQSLRQSGIVRTQDRWIGGVAGGVARRFGLDPLLVRGLLAVSLLIAGVGLVLYALAWAFLPEEIDGRIHFQEMVRGNFDGALLGSLVFLIMGFSWDGVGFSVFPWIGNWLGGLLWLGAIGGLIALVVITINKQRSPSAGRYRQTPPYGPANYGPADDAPPHGSGAHETGSGTYETSAYGSGVHGQGTYGSASQAPYAPATQRPTPPAPPRVRGPGIGLIGSLLGLWALAVAGLLLAERTGNLDISANTLSLGLLVGLAGVGVVIAGLRGRSAGTLGVIGVVTIVLTLPTTIWSTTNLDLGSATRTGFSSETFQPTTADQARNGYAMVAGDWVVDLRDLSDSNRLIEIPVTMAAGDLTVKVPNNLSWVADVRLVAGEVRVTTPSESTSRSGLFLGGTTFSSDSVTRGAAPTVRLDIRGAAGQITIVEEES